MEEIKDYLLLSGQEENSNNKHIKAKRYLLLGLCVAVGLFVGVTIGYFSFREQSKSPGNVQINSKSDKYAKYIEPMSGSWNIEVNFDISVDINTLISQIGSGLSATAFSERKFKDGSRFISCLDGGYVISCYNHPNKYHSATAVGGFLAPTARSEKPPGEWAIAKVSAGVWGRETHFDSWD